MGLKRNKKSEELPRIEWDALACDLRRLGYLLPIDDEELAEFNKDLPLIDVQIPKHLYTGSFLFSKNTSESSKLSDTKKSTSNQTTLKTTGPKKDYFKKIVLAAEIAHKLHAEATFGHKKFVKLLYLCEEVCNMQLSTRYGRYAAGPLDPKLMYSIDSEFKKQNWFKVVKRESFGYRYEPLEDMEKYKKYFSNYFGNQTEQIEFLIELFRNEKSDFCEAVATLFYIWKDCMSNHSIINNNILIQNFYSWDESKKRFTEVSLKQTIDWMVAKGIVP